MKLQVFSTQKRQPLATSIAVALGLAAGVSFLGSTSAHAQTATWIGNNSALWNDTTGNWSGGLGTGGQPASGDSLVFGTAGTAGATLTDDLMTPATFNVAGITFNAGASAFTINPATAGTNGFTLTGGVTNSSTNLQTINSLVALSAGAHTFTTTAAGGDITLGGIVSGTGSLSKAGAGVLTLSGANTFNGGVALNGGTLALGSSGAIGSAGTISFAGGTLQYGASNTTDYSSRFSTAASQAYNVDTNGQNVTWATALTSSGATLTKSGSGTLTLSGTNTYSGANTINGGVVSIAANANLGSVTVGQAPVSLNGGTVRTTAGITNTHAFTIGASGGTINVTTTGQYFFNTANTLLGSGPLTLTGNGTLTANTGNLRVGQTNTYSGAVTMQSGGIFEYGVAGAVAAGATFAISNQGEVSVNNGVTMPNAITVNGGTNSVISFENGTTGTYSGTVTLNANAIVGLRDWYNNVTVRGGTISGKITGTGGLTVNSGTGSGGVLTLSNTTNDYSGGTTINASAVAFTKTTAMPASGTVLVNSGATLSVNAGGAGEFTNGTSGNGTIGGLFAGVGGQGAPVTLASGSVVGINTTNATGGVLTYSGDVTNAGVGLAKQGAGTLILSGANTYTGGTNITAGTLQFQNPTSMPATGTVAVAGGTTLAVNIGGAGEFTNATSGNGSLGGLIGLVGGQGAPITFASGSSLGLDTTNAVGEVTYGNAIAIASTGLIKLGTGTLTLSGGGTFAGNGAAGFPLVARTGTLRLNGGAYSNTGETVVGDNVVAGGAGTNVSLIMDAGSLTTSTFFSVARGNGTGTVSSDLVLNGSSTISSNGFGIGFNAGSAANLPKGTVTLNGTSKITNTANNNTFNVGESAGSVATMTLNDSSTVQHNGNAAITRVGLNGKGLINVNSATATFLARAFTLGTANAGVGAVYNKGVLTMSQGIFIADNGTTGTTTSSGYLRNDNSGAAASSVPAMNVGAVAQNANTTGHAVFDNMSGTLGTITQGIGMSVAGNASVQNSQINVLGGTVTAASTTFAGSAGAANKYGNINVSGASSLYTNTGTVNLGGIGASTNTGLLTVRNGGTITADTFTAAAAANSFINLDNGTVKAQIGTTGSLINLAIDRVTVYSGGGIFDTNGFNKTIDAPIATPTGNGITSISLSGTGTGYIGRPIVKITDSTGTGATAIADFDPVTGQVTGVTITSPGSGYTAPVVTILGCGGTAVTATATLGTSTGGGITKVGNGTLTLTAANTYTGPTNVTGGTLVASGSIGGSSFVNVSSGATFQLGAANLVGNSAALTLSGGTFATGGLSETAGTLSLGSGASTIDFGSGASVFNLANSSSLTWTGTLSITNWTGSTLGGGTDQLYFGNDASGLTGAQIASIQFIDPAGFSPGSYGAQMLPSGELIVAVPEPGSLVALIGGTACLLGLRRRRRGA